MSEVKANAKAIKAQRRAEKVAAKGAESTPAQADPQQQPQVVATQATKKQGHVKPNTSIKNDAKKQQQPQQHGQEPKAVPKPRSVALFSHLEHRAALTTETVPRDIHPAVISFALQCSRGQVIGSNERCRAMLRSFQRVIADYSVPTNLQTSLQRHLPTYLSAQISYLVTARPLSISMGSAIRLLKQQISKTDIEASDDANKERLNIFIDTFIRERIEMAGQVIVKSAQSRIIDGDVILVYAHSTIVEAILLAASERVSFRVVVVDSRPKFEGRVMVRRLLRAGIPCTYVMLTAIGHIISTVDKVFLGAHTVLANGAVYSRAGTALVALTASESHKPVIVACETYKFSDRVQLDSFVTNELGLTTELDLRVSEQRRTEEHEPLKGKEANTGKTSSTATAEKQQQASGTKPTRESQVLKLNLLYDVTPDVYITLCISELGSLPTTAIPFAALSEQD